jgi:GMP synthase-like glutamine amidotransferase
VQDQWNRAILGARVSIRRSGNVTSAQEATTNATGAAKFTNIAPDTYFVNATKPGFRPPKQGTPRASTAWLTSTDVFAGDNSVTVVLVPERTEILYLDIEHQKNVTNEAPHQEAHKDHVVDIAKNVIPTVRGRRVWYGDLDNPQWSFLFTPSTAPPMNVLALFISGNVTEWVDYVRGGSPSLDKIKSLIRTTPIPIHAVCGGHQLVAKAMNNNDAAVDHVHPPNGMPDDYEHNGVTRPVSLTNEGQRDPIYQNVTPEFRFFHHDEVTVLHPNATLLATTVFSPKQSIRYSSNDGGDALIYTTQFHPEQDDSGYHNGEDYLKNFYGRVQKWWWNHE